MTRQEKIKPLDYLNLYAFPTTSKLENITNLAVCLPDLSFGRNLANQYYPVRNTFNRKVSGNPQSTMQLQVSSSRICPFLARVVLSIVKGRVSTAGFIPKQIVISSTRDTASSSRTPIAPESVLFRHKRAPTRYAEFDIYFAHERELKNDLPESDLLKELHCYASDFYSHFATGEGTETWRSMDETALLGFGILMEEYTRAILGQNGDLVFTEGEEIDNDQRIQLATAAQSTRQHSFEKTDSNVASISGKEKAPRRKKRRLTE